jgi:hypothetical protein
MVLLAGTPLDWMVMHTVLDACQDRQSHRTARPEAVRRGGGGEELGKGGGAGC